MNDKIQKTRAEIARFGAMLFERHLTDAAGGNVSALVDDVVCLSPAHSGSQRQWQLTPEDVLVVNPKDRTILAGNGSISREASVHFKLYELYSSAGTAVIHCHARNVMVFAAMAKSMPPVLEANQKFGEAKVVEYAPAHSVQLAENIAEGLSGQEDRIKKHAAGVIAPWHGLFLMGKDLAAAFDAVERFDTNAYCIMMAQQMLGTNDMLAEQRQALVESIARFKA